MVFFDGYCDNMAWFAPFLFYSGCFSNGIIICSSSVPKRMMADILDFLERFAILGGYCFGKS
jgi:hypothetical protein